MGGGRAGWYSWDSIDNGGTPSAHRVVPELQTIVPGDVMPAVPGATDAFIVTSVDPPHDLVLTVPDGQGGNVVAWEHVLDRLDDSRTRLIVRGRASSRWLDLARASPLRRITESSSNARTPGWRACRVRWSSASRTGPPLHGSAAFARHRATRYSTRVQDSEGEARFRAAYDAALKTWPVPYEQFDVPTRFGKTHVIACGHGRATLGAPAWYMATSVMWAPNIGDFSRALRVYAIDTMGQPSKSIPGNRSAVQLITWLADRNAGRAVPRSRQSARHVVRRMAGAYLRVGGAGACAQPGVAVAGGILPLSRQLKPARTARGARPYAIHREFIDALAGFQVRAWRVGGLARRGAHAPWHEALSNTAGAAACSHESVVGRRTAEAYLSRYCC
jgi:hypothetical protein